MDDRERYKEDLIKAIQDNYGFDIKRSREVLRFISVQYAMKVPIPQVINTLESKYCLTKIGRYEE